MIKRTFITRSYRYNNGNYGIKFLNIIGFIILLLCHLLYYAVWVFMPFLIWHFAKLDHVCGGRVVQYKEYMILFCYFVIAIEFMKNPGLLFPLGTAWIERIHRKETIQVDQIIYNENSNYYSRNPAKFSSKTKHSERPFNDW